ncbi:hypothetical protein TRFO_33962 [Tritrichomonas foetus]|uniref:Uncharacterized protein n=1 Tax=Tritrichomonas foetus TaxID=1144522 RepID=A0A1J4JK83_9EUKA|nr:hypothetical protein TRFO_33962 [Tritrichomonas foetus]|eukprot:OHS99552.1 hypothetical protein TRFO_33962 [Tritrichomonas foetus]
MDARELFSITRQNALLNIDRGSVLLRNFQEKNKISQIQIKYLADIVRLDNLEGKMNAEAEILQKNLDDSLYKFRKEAQKKIHQYRKDARNQQNKIIQDIVIAADRLNRAKSAKIQNSYDLIKFDDCPNFHSLNIKEEHTVDSSAASSPEINHYYQKKFERMKFTVNKLRMQKKQWEDTIAELAEIEKKNPPKRSSRKDHTSILKEIINVV